MPFRTHARSPSASNSIASSSTSVDEGRPQNRPSRIAVVGRGREALALSPNTAEEFRHNLSLAVCSSPELTIPTNYPPPNPNPGPVLRRIASEAPYKYHGKSGIRTSRLPPLSPSASRAKGLPPPPRPRRRPPPVFVTTLGAPLALAEQSYSPFVAPDVMSPRRSASVPPSAVSSSFWGCGGEVESSEEDLDLDGLDAVYDEYEFSEGEEGGVKSALGGTYFPPTVAGGRYCPSPPGSPRKTRGSALDVRQPLRVQVSVERVAFRDETYQQPRHYQSSDEVMLGRNMGGGVAQGLPDLEDGIKTRAVELEAVHALGGQRATKVSIGKALGRWLKRRT
ncbi:hypothetical protein FRC06_002682 [Ceratobasidium sp. 370]|nr:hypothetical protein FRC06_002682 [Ceratobasidium sp. 370]